MKKQSWIGVGVLGLLLWSPQGVQAQQRQVSGSVTLSQRSVDGARGTVLRTGRYQVVALVGQGVTGGVRSGSGGIWQVQQRLKASQAEQGVSAESEVPRAYALEGNYPNPFNPETTIGFGLPEASAVRLSVYDVLGRQVAVLVDRTMEAGRHEVRFGGGELSSGLYVYRLEAGSFEAHRTMLLVK